MNSRDRKDHLDEKGQWTIKNFHDAPAFASFLPGLAGIDGIPIWAFYVNRGQGMASFGVSNKNHAILEFLPANKAFEQVHLKGFRTFIKIQDGNQTSLFEPFSPHSNLDESTKMKIGQNWLELQSICMAAGIETAVRYYILPSEPFGGLVREVKIKNISGNALKGEIYDGLPGIIPDGVSDQINKNMSNTAVAWMKVDLVKPWLPFYRISASIEDITEIREQKSGHFYICGKEEENGLTWIEPVVDPALIFGEPTTKLYPTGIMDTPLSDKLKEDQILSGRVPCGFFGSSFELAPENELVLRSIIGNVADERYLNDMNRFTSSSFWETKFENARQLPDTITAPVRTKTGSPVFDQYCSQSLLDNTLRGGFPLRSGEENGDIYYVFNRKHGDLERDYNFFNTLPEYFSTGNGNYRDINQNRRLDLWFQPMVFDSNIKTFMNLIQTDGYNPLEYRGQEFQIRKDAMNVLEDLVDDPAALEKILNKPFTPGSVLRSLEENSISVLVPMEKFVFALINHSHRTELAEFHEGYWVDHWAYNLDLIENFINVYPDKMETLLFHDDEYFYWDTAVKVNPRKDRYHEVGGTLIQTNALIVEEEHQNRINRRLENRHAVRTGKGSGEIYRSNLYNKLLVIAFVKFSTMDPEGLGIEMEAGKPGWCDALNGLPALFASSMSETFELKRLYNFLIKSINGTFDPKPVLVPIEIFNLYSKISKNLKKWQNDNNHFEFWDACTSALETYRNNTHTGFIGDESEIEIPKLAEFLETALEKISDGIERAKIISGGLIPTYFTYKPDYSLLDSGDIVIKSFKAEPLPIFLEGCVKAILSAENTDEARKLHNEVLRSPLYDNGLGMFRVNGNIKNEQPLIGRIWAFPRGWLENEAIFLHMHYKYLLALLKSGCYKEFWEHAKKGLVPFMDPEKYGRSTLENVSFIVSSVYPDRKMHGKGLYARLSGSTVEFLDMWRHIMSGDNPFTYDQNEIYLKLSPILPGWLFDENDCVSYTIFGTTRVIYKNPSRKNLFPGEYGTITNLTLHDYSNVVHEQDKLELMEPWATMIRENKISKIEVTF